MSRFVAPALAAAPFAGFPFEHESDWAENLAALVASLDRVAAVLFE
jgi:hypothetical protein